MHWKQGRPEKKNGKARKMNTGLDSSDVKRSVIGESLAAGVQCSQEERGLFCCAVVLLAVIGQRADYLRSGDDMRQCVSDWNTVYLS